MHLNPKSLRHRRAFTLVEMLVVIAIISALAGLSFMSVRSLRAKANAASSASNIRQIYVGHQTYLAEYNEFPGESNWGSSIVPEENNVDCTSWCHRIAPFVGLGTSLRETQELFQEGLLPPGVFLVPGRKRLMEGDGGFVSGYVRSGKINVNHMKLPPDSFKNLNSFSRLSGSFFLIDTGGESPGTDFNGWEVSKAARLKWPAHGGKTNSLEGQAVVCFLDGRVQTLSKGELPSNHKNVFWNPPIESN